MLNATGIAVSLQRADGAEVNTVVLYPNRSGQLPVVLVDPVDGVGLVVPGMWIGNGLGGTSYRWVEPVGARGTRRRSETGDEDVLSGGRALTDQASLQALLRRTQSQLAHLGLHDALTGLSNRNLLMVRVQRALAKRTRGVPVTLLAIDLDRFNVVNDSLGHDVGDAWLLYAAKRIAAATRAQDTVARLGGDEFFVLCDAADAAGASVVAERIVDAFRESAVVDGHELRITASVGIVAANQSHGPGDLLREAGAAMRQAKGQGGNQVSRFEISHSRKASRLLDMEQALERGLVREEFVLFYQPIYSIADGSLHGVEALVRWERPHHGLVPPDEFIPLAEETGLIIPLGSWVLDEALRQLRVWKSAGIVPDDFRVSVNLSPVQLADPGLVDTIKRMLVAHNLVHSDLTLEMTETALITDQSMMTEIVTSLAEAGASLSIDDFGTGYSSLSYLRYLPAKQLKVDRSFVSGLTTNAHDAALVAAVVGLAHEFGMTCVAEGVETPEQLERLHSLGCDFAQGYLLGRPSPAADLTQAWQAEHEKKMT